MSARRSSHRDDRRDAGGGGSGRVSRDDMDRLADRVDRMHGLLDSTGRLALQTAHRIGSASAQRSLVFFCKGGVKQDLTTAWASWKSTSRLAPGDRPPVRPTPWRQQVANRFLAYVATAGRETLELATHLEALQALPMAVEAISHGEPPESDAWPIVVTFRNSESAFLLRENLLHERWRPLQGRDKELGWRPARHMPSGPARAVLQGLGLDKGGGKGKRRSPKREGSDSAPSAPARRQRT